MIKPVSLGQKFIYKGHEGPQEVFTDTAHRFEKQT